MVQDMFPSAHKSFSIKNHDHRFLDYADIDHDHDGAYSVSGHDHVLDSGWYAITSFLNGATAYSTDIASAWTPRYRKVNGIVYLQGLINTNVATNPLIVTTLPSGFRPRDTQMELVRNAAGARRMDILGGQIIFREGDTSTGFHSIASAFPADF